MPRYSVQDLPLAERDTELEIVERRIEEAVRGRGSLLLISGEGGIGKTALAAEAARRAAEHGALAATGRCYEGSAPAFGLWQDLLDDLAGSESLDFSALPRPFGSGPAVDTAYQLMHAVVGALRRAAEREPLALLLDDLHWADRDALDLLDLLTRRLEAVPLLLLATYRTDDVSREHPLYDLLPHLRHDRPVVDLPLRRLSRAAVGLVTNAICGSSSPQFIDGVYARSEGNPYFLRELLRDFTEQRTAAHASEPPLPAQPGVVPVTLRQIIVRRVARLGERAEQLLQVGAVIGVEWDLGVVETVLGWAESDLLAALEAALHAHVIEQVAEEGERYRFTHGLIAEVLYSEQLARRRIHLHERVAVALESRVSSPADQASLLPALARHYHLSERWTKAVQYATAAGDAARGRHGSRSALQFYELAIELLQRVPDPELAEKAALYERSGQVRMVLHQLEAARRDFAQMVRAAEAGGDTAAQARGLYWLSFVLARLSHLEEARSTGNAAAELARETGDARLLAAAHWNLGRLYAVSGELDIAPRHLNEAERLARLEHDGVLLGRCLMERARLANWHAEYAQAERHAVEGLELARDGRDSLVLAGLCWMLGIALGELGRYARAREIVQQGLHYAAEVDDMHYPVKLLNTLGWIHSEVGDTEIALRYDQQALDAVRRGQADPIREAECYCLLNLATDCLQAGDIEGAERQLEQFETIDQGIEYARFRYFNRYGLTRAQVALARHDPAGALRWARQAEEAASAKGMRKNLAKSLLLTGQALTALKKTPEAILCLHRAVALADELHHGSLRWQTRLRLGQALRQARQRESAAVVLEEAHVIIEALSSGLDDERLRQAFMNSAAVREVVAAERAGTSAVTYPAALTAREVEVLRLLAAGASNKVIAEELHISVKTVNAHLDHIFTKTDSGNRAAAAAFAVRHGLVEPEADR